MTVDTGPTRWLTGEFGAALMIAIGATAWLFWRARDAVESPDELLFQRTGAATRSGMYLRPDKFPSRRAV